MKVLVTSSRNPFALDLVRKLASTGHSVVATDTYHGALGSHSRYLSGHAITASPRFATDQYIADISRIVTEHEIDLILPTFEEAFYLSARRGDLPDGVTLYTGEFPMLARLHDKVSFQRFAGEAGVPVPETVVATDDATLHDAIGRFGQYFARAAFSRGGVALLTNTGPLAGHLLPENVHPSEDQPWLVQPFVSGPMVCTYSTVQHGTVTAHCTYVAPEQWAHSTGITFLAIDSTETLAYAQRIAGVLGDYTGQLSFDFVNHDGHLYGIECNPRTTDGVMLMTADQVSDGLRSDGLRSDKLDDNLLNNPDTTSVVPEGTESEIKLAVLADAFTEPLSHLHESVHDVFRVSDVGKGWHDQATMLWSPAALMHGARLARGHREAALAALSEDIVWNGEAIQGMSPEYAKVLEDVHAQRL